MKRILFSLAVLATSIVSSQVLIDDTNTVETPTAGAVLDLNSEDKGLLLPRLGVTQVNDDMKQEGMVFYDANGKCFKGWDGRNWQVLGDDCLPPTDYTLAITITEPFIVEEGDDQTFEVSVLPTPQPGVVITVEYATAGVSATEGADYTGITGTLTFDENNPGPLSIIVNTIDDQEEEALLETYTMTLSSPEVTGFGNVSIITSEAVGTIQDNDAAAGVMMVKETFGNPSGTPSIIGYTGFDNTNLTFYAEGDADVRTTLASSQYSEASGGGNVMINRSNKSLMISGFNYTSVSGPLTLQMGIRKGPTDADGSSLTIEYSTDNGLSWTDITYSGLPTGGGTSNWYYVTISDNISNEITDLRFQGTDTTEYRLDDIELTY